MLPARNPGRVAAAGDAQRTTRRRLTAVADAGDVSLSDLPVDVGNGLGNHILSLRRVEFVRVDVVQCLEVVAEMRRDLDRRHSVKEQETAVGVP